MDKIVRRTLVSNEMIGPEDLLATDNYNFSSGQLEGSYRGYQDKIWQIQIPPKCQLRILFEDFDLEGTESCSNDYFFVQTRKRIRKYCNSLESITIEGRRRVQLWFHADKAREGRGFYAWFCFNSLASNSTRQCDCNQGVAQPQNRRKRSEMRGKLILLCVVCS